MKQITALVDAAEATTLKRCVVCCGEIATVEDAFDCNDPVCELHTAERNATSHPALNMRFGRDDDFGANGQ